MNPSVDFRGVGHDFCGKAVVGEHGDSLLIMFMDLKKGGLFRWEVNLGAVSEGDVSPVEVGSGVVEMVKDFTYLGSNLSSDCEAT